METEPSQKIQSIVTTHRILRKLEEFDCAGVTRIASELDITKSTVHQYLATLQSEGYVIKEDHSYRLGLKYLQHGMYVRDNHPIVDLSRPSIAELVDRTGEIGWCTCEEFGELVTLDIRVGEHNINEKFRGRIGNREFLHAHAGGKAILAAYPDERVEEIVDTHGLPEYTDRTITDESELFGELERIRDDGVAFNDEEAITGYRAVGSAVSQDGETIGSITIGGPKSRLNGEYYTDELPDMIRGAVNEIELRGSVESPWN